MEKKTYSLFAGVLLFIQTNAQVGIKTASPNATLDVNGATTLRKELRVGGTSTQVGNSGLNGQVLVSQGEGLPPAWKSLNVPLVETGQYKLTNSYLFSDQNGITTFTNSGDGIYKSNVGDDISDTNTGKWIKLGAVANAIEIKNGNNRITYQFQTGVEMRAPVSTTSENITFACGVFRNGKLVAVRPDKISSNNNSGKNGLQDYIFTLNYTEQDVPVGTHQIEVACRKINSSNPNSAFAIGHSLVTQTGDPYVSNNFILESEFKMDIIEFITY
ncbi:hypothetical protein SAMN05421856_104288 [Chryseobacterium taichungense]|uniref:Uncharacterized protein n=1 Tax=Chryseobacterium taichungense TaxID=295069 RepID=A0A1H7ZH33_9FLAO|nr:hypothetical protein [Chryseobacterium taichungense]SEM57872.1 hypothetical protein SAMN05421856_104288 [Chryseobacterium taichungense]